MSDDTKPAHSEIGASSMERWANCPASVRLSRGIPNVSSAYAQEGTLAHELAADWLQQGKLPPDDTDPETYDAISVYVNHVQDVWKSLQRHENTKLFIEHKFDLTEIYPGLYGTADAVIYDGANQILYVMDLKFGKGIPVSPENNPQLMYYGLGALMSMKVPVSNVILQIIQPRYSTDIKEAIKTCEVDPISMVEFAADLKIYADATTKEDAAISIGDHCQFCRAQPMCPAKLEEKRAAVNKAFAPENLPALLPEEVGSLLDKVDSIESWCKSVREYAYALSQSTKIPGYKRVPKQARRKWNDPANALKSLEMMFADTTVRECLSDPEIKSPAQVEKILGKANKDFLDSLCSAVSSGEVLVPDSDKRPEANSTTKAELMFGELKE
jgi:hypothetical protein